MVKLSIITINYNNNVGLIKTIESIINQTWQEFEYIIIDGGSTDGSLETIAKYKDHIDYYVSEKDNGVYDAMNKGINIAKGSYINFMNSGDFYFDNTILEAIHEKLDLKVGVAYGNSFYFNEEGYDRVEKTPSELSFSHFFTSGINHQASFIKRDLFFKYFMYNTEYKICADWEFFLYAICKRNEPYLHLNKTICYYDFSGISANPANLNTYYQEREEILRKYFPLFYDDYIFFDKNYDRRIRKLFQIQKNKILWRTVKIFITIFLLILPKEKKQNKI